MSSATICVPVAASCMVSDRLMALSIVWSTSAKPLRWEAVVRTPGRGAGRPWASVSGQGYLIGGGGGSTCRGRAGPGWR